MSPNLDTNALDRYITGNYGEDQFDVDFDNDVAEETFSPIDEELDSEWV